MESSSEHFSLSWNNFHTNLSSGFNSLLREGDLVDVTLAVEGRYVKAHKTVLSVCSPYFRELFRINPCDHPIVILQDVRYSALNSVLEFMYQGEVSVRQEEIPAFMKVAQTLRVKGLTDNNATETQTDATDVTPVVMSSRPQMLKRRPVRKPVRPLQHLRQDEPPAKRVDVSEDAVPVEEVATVKPKEEILDVPDSGAGEVKLPVAKEESAQDWSQDLKVAADVSIPGTLQCIIGKRGNPRLIVDGHVFYKKSAYKDKLFWYCKCSRNFYRCPAVCWTYRGDIIKWPHSHNHPPITDNFNPEEDSLVPIARIREVLTNA